jgi:hypothetical protein
MDLEEQEAILKKCIEQLESVDMARINLINQLKVALNEQVSSTFFSIIFQMFYLDGLLSCLRWEHPSYNDGCFYYVNHRVHIAICVHSLTHVNYAVGECTQISRRIIGRDSGRTHSYKHKVL